jgi:hypothetical protein
MDDAIARYCAASTANDMTELAATLAPDVELASPVSGRMVFRGRDDVAFLLSRVYGMLVTSSGTRRSATAAPRSRSATPASSASA